MPMRLLALIVLVLTAAGAQEPEREFALDGISLTVALSDEWKQVAKNATAGVMLMKTTSDGERISLVLNKQPNTRGLEGLKAMYEREFQRAHVKFKLLGSFLEKVGEIPVLKIVHENETPGKAVRQVFYVFDFGEVSCCMTLSGMQDKGDKYDQEFSAIVASLRKK